MMDQTGYRSATTTGNFEYVLGTNYTATWDTSGPMPESSTTTQFYSYALSDDSELWSDELECGYYSGVMGVNCGHDVNTAPGGGSGCSSALGTSTSANWNYFMMGNWGSSGSILGICNGYQVPVMTEGSDFNMRTWIRER